MKVAVVGTGFVGLVTGVCFAEKGHEVLCVDVDRNKVDMINRGISPIFEYGLDELLKKNIGVGLRATTDLYQAIHNSDVSMIAVGTPFDGQHIDLTYVKTVSQQIGSALRTKSAYHLVVVKSTVVPGTTDGVVLQTLEQASGKKAGVDFGVGMNPEFLTEGEAVSDFMNPDRIVLGGIDKASIDLQAQLYQQFTYVEMQRTNNRTAEMIKYASNSLLATMISFSNEIGNLCTARGGVDVVDVLQGVHSSRYLRMQLPNGESYSPPITSFLGVGCGFGGSCLPKDVKALVAHGTQAGVEMPLLSAVLEVNRDQPQRLLALAKKHLPSLVNVKVTVLGLAFRPGTNDMRESPAIPIIRALIQEGAKVRGFDPIANQEAAHIFKQGEVEFSQSLKESLYGSQLVILVTRWPEFQEVPKLLSAMNPAPVFVDGRRMLDKSQFRHYEGIGL